MSPLKWVLGRSSRCASALTIRQLSLRHLGLMGRTSRQTGVNSGYLVLSLQPARVCLVVPELAQAELHLGVDVFRRVAFAELVFAHVSADGVEPDLSAGVGLVSEVDRVAVVFLRLGAQFFAVGQRHVQGFADVLFDGLLGQRRVRQCGLSLS